MSSEKRQKTTGASTHPQPRYDVHQTFGVVRPNNAGGVRVTYWRGRGRCEPLRCILAISGTAFENVYLSQKSDRDELVASGKLAYDQVPLVEVDGLNLVQATPTAICEPPPHCMYTACTISSHDAWCQPNCKVC